DRGFGTRCARHCRRFRSRRSPLRHWGRRSSRVDASGPGAGCRGLRRGDGCCWKEGAVATPCPISLAMALAYSFCYRGELAKPRTLLAADTDILTLFSAFGRALDQLTRG